MEIKCQEHYDKVQEYATKIGDTTLNECIERLKSWEQNPRRKCVIELRKDRAPHSFMFYQRYEDGTYGIIGGLMYHGDPDLSGSYQIEKKQGWQTHT